MIKLYGGGANRWVRPYWTLQELGLPFEKHVVSIMKGETRKPEFLAKNPFAKLPVLEDGDFVLYESAAICKYLADQHPEKGLIPRAGTRERALVDQWISLGVTELEQPLWRATRHTFIYPESQRLPAEIAIAKDDFRRAAEVVEAQLHGDFLVGNRFSVADIVVTYSLKWAALTRIMNEDLTAGFPKVQAYMSRMTARPNFPKELYLS